MSANRADEHPDQHEPEEERDQREDHVPERQARAADLGAASDDQEREDPERAARSGRPIIESDVEIDVMTPPCGDGLTWPRPHEGDTLQRHRTLGRSRTTSGTARKRSRPRRAVESAVSGLCHDTDVSHATADRPGEARPPRPAARRARAGRTRARRAQALILAGKVRVGDGDAARLDHKPGDTLDPADRRSTSRSRSRTSAAAGTSSRPRSTRSASTRPG